TDTPTPEPTPPPQTASPIGNGCPVDFPVKVAADNRAYDVTARRYTASVPVVCYINLAAANAAGYQTGR
ncbi:MAG TPA: hypothetical protein VFD32_22985, partial [Dehalococcoidia bacterium]|nr:hypothetical protein [Dehalococcoidia bacterium]